MHLTIIGKGSCSTKIDYFEEGVAGLTFKENILRFYIPFLFKIVFRVSLRKRKLIKTLPMNNVIFMAIKNSRKYLFDYNCSFLFRKNLPFHNLVEKLPSSTKFRDNINILIILIKFKYFDNIRVILKYFEGIL